jgi:ferric-dicitrate binding protein FerR (iron transport regulator)
MTTQADRIILLIIRNLNNELDEAGRAELQQWMDESEHNREAVEEFLTDEQLRKGIGNLYALKERIWRRLDESIPDDAVAAHRIKPVGSSPFLWRYAAAAAVLVLLAGSAYLFLNRGGPALSSHSPAAGTHSPARLRNDVTPGGNNAVLILAGGSAITLDSAKSGNLARLGHTNVVKLNNGELAYHSSDGGEQEPDGANILRTPRRGQYRLILPDGTRVWLNAASSIQFPTVFRGSERKVTVTGEAYFEVAKNVSQPFIVNIDNRMQVEVLGTRFNVNAYTDEASVNTTLLAGSVRVIHGSKTTLLTPDQQSREYTDGKSEVVNGVDIEAIVAWKNGQFQFESDGIKAVMRQLARWYDVEVEYSGVVPGGTFSGEVSRNTNLSNVLRILELSGLHFKIEDNKVTVLP